VIRLPDNLEKTLAYTNATEDADYKSQVRPDGDQEIDTILSSLSASIDWLHRLANLVRRASTSRQNAKASTFLLKDDQGGDATPVLEKLFRYWIKRDFPNVADDFCERLISTMILRRRRILYRRSRQNKLALRTAERIRKPQHLAAPSASAGIEEKLRELPEAPVAPMQAPSGVASTQQTATTVEPQTYLQVKSTPSRVSGAKTIAMTSGIEEMIPPPPHIAGNALEFICPFCSLILPAKDARNRGRGDAWTAHVKKDLDPYVCSFLPCARGEDIFSTSADWISHMQQTHCMRWYCTLKTHKPEAFTSIEEYITHMTAEHPGKFKETQLPFLAANSQRPLRRIFQACPFCGEEGIKKGETLEDHVAHHLQYLAVLSLPLPEDVYDAEGTASTSSADSHTQKKDNKAAASRATRESEWHLLPPATFPDGDEYLWGTARPGDDETPDIEQQMQSDSSQRWQIIRASKLGLASMDQPVTEEEQRGDKTLARFILHFDSMHRRLQKRPDIRAWLSPPDHSIDHQKARDARLHQGPDHWFLKDKIFMNWKTKPASFLWLTGIPGSGKTPLTSAIIDSLQRDTLDPERNSHVLLYFYFSDKQSFDSTIRSLVTQLHENHEQAQKHLNLLWSSCQDGRQQPSAEVLSSIFKKMLEDAGEVWMVLESLDKCGFRDDTSKPGLFWWLSSVHSHQTNLHLLVTSRPEEDIRSAIETFAEGDYTVDVYQPLLTLLRGSLRVSSGSDQKEFLPIDKLEDIVTEVAVYRELRRHGHFTRRTDENLFSLASSICGVTYSARPNNSGIMRTRKRIFAILVLMERVDVIEAFIQEGRFDSHLPFNIPRNFHDVYYISTNSGIRALAFSTLRLDERMNFKKCQWQLLAPFFTLVSTPDTRPSHYVLEDSHILPFVYDDEEMQPPRWIEGGYSEVRRVRIHHAHHSDPSVRCAYSCLLPSHAHTQLMSRFRRRAPTHISRLNVYDPATAAQKCFERKSQHIRNSAAKTTLIS
jgi:hypothetical protein